MYSHGINIFDKADGNHLVLGIAHHFKLQLLPSKNRLLHQHLAHETSRQASADNGAQFLDVVYMAAPPATHGISRAQNHRITKIISNSLSLFHSESWGAVRHLEAKFIHGILESNSILTTLDGIHLNPDNFDTVFFKHPCPRQFRRQIQSRLA